MVKIQKIVEEEVKIFEDDILADALDSCLNAGCKPLYMPQMADLKIANNDALLWDKWCDTPSAIVTGLNSKGKKVVVYAHCDNFLSNPENIRNAVNDSEYSSKNHYGAVFPKEEFDRLVGMEDNKSVFVVDYNVLMKSKNDVIPVKNALEHPMVIPFLGGEERAKQYLEKHKEIKGKDIGVWHTDDLRDEPIGRLAFLGYYFNLDGSNNLYSDGRFFGVRGSGATASGGAADDSAESDAQKIELAFSIDHVHEAKDDLENLKKQKEILGATNMRLSGIEELLKRL